MMAGYQKRPNTPAAVERTLRQEAGFGCARCGHPYFEYHHIVPWAEEQHFRPEDMVALCGNCHPAVATFARDRQYDIKADPHNKRTGVMSGALEYDKRDLVFKVGGVFYENAKTVLRYCNLPIIACRLDDGQAKVSLNLLSQWGHPLLTVIDNEVAFRVDDLWDFEYTHGWAVARNGPGDIALRMDFTGAEATIEGKLWLGPDQQIKLGPTQTILPGNNTFTGGRFSGVAVGIQIGDEKRSPPQWRFV
jgi:hypothetical protein